jgi:hypothetical protein
MTHHVYGHPVYTYLHISAMVAIKTSQKYLFRLSTSGMLRYKKPGHHPQQFLRAFHGVQIKVYPGNAT